jgi:small subunit ribosomal protein S20
MANTAAAKKEARASVGRTLRNRSVRSSVKTGVAKARRVIGDGTEGALEAALAAISSLDRAAEKGIVHPNNAARRKSRLMKRLNAIGAAPAAAPAKGEKGKGGRTKTASKPAAKKAPARRTTAKK